MGDLINEKQHARTNLIYECLAINNIGNIYKWGKLYHILFHIRISNSQMRLIRIYKKGSVNGCSQNICQ